ncbi:MAG TPA: YdcF family protein [Dehalococcoidia bacterium]|jgi:uncharacterized SAM-binding protein YcdF (DUF218 family)
MNLDFDCIVVLGHSARPDDEIMRARVALGADLYKKGIASAVIMSGAYSFRLRADPPPLSEAAVMRDVALALGVPKADILIEDESTDTLSNAYFTKVRFLAPMGWRRVCVVTSEVHAERARWLFHKVLGPLYTVEMRESSSTAQSTTRREGMERNERLLRQIQAVLADIPDGADDLIGALLFERHPGYVADPQQAAAIEAALL